MTQGNREVAFEEGVLLARECGGLYVESLNEEDTRLQDLLARVVCDNFE